jgi:glycosyltransferase involved in cell wall biosynthesis
VTSLRIAHVTNEAFGFDTANGVQHVVYCLARAQAELGHVVAVFSRDDNAVNVLGGRAEPTSPTPRQVPSGFEGSFRQRLLARYLEATLAADLLTWRPQLVHFHSVHIPQNVALASHLRRAGIPYCVTVHGALFPAALQRGRVKKSLFHLLFERRYLNEACFIHAVSPHETQVIRRVGVDCPIVLVPNGVPPGGNLRGARPESLYAVSPWLRDRLVFMFIGRLDTWQKGLDLLIHAFARAGLQDAGLVLVGPDCRGSRQELRRLAERLGILSAVVFMEPAFGEERANLLSAADVFVHPSRWEGLSLSVLAAAAAGKACMITRHADPLGELGRSQAAIVVEPSVSSIVEGLKRTAALKNDERQLMGTRARRVVEASFSWPSIAGTLVEAYQRALATARIAAAGRQRNGAPADRALGQ